MAPNDPKAAPRSISRLLLDLIDVAGHPLVNELIRLRGGRRFYVPTTARGRNRVIPELTRAAGADAVRRFVQRYGGTEVTVPQRNAIWVRERIVALTLARTHSVAAIAEELNCTERTVYLVRRTTRVPRSTLRESMARHHAARAALPLPTTTESVL